MFSGVSLGARHCGSAAILLTKFRLFTSRRGSVRSNSVIAVVSCSRNLSAKCGAMVSCAVVGCNRRSIWNADGQDQFHFFKILGVKTKRCAKPRALSAERRSEWVARIKRASLDTEHLDKYKVCSRHFASGPASVAQLAACWLAEVKAVGSIPVRGR